MRCNSSLLEVKKIDCSLGFVSIGCLQAHFKERRFRLALALGFNHNRYLQNQIGGREVKIQGMCELFLIDVIFVGFLAGL
jgi:hypothetical protein